MSNMRESKGYRAVEWLGYDVVLDRDEDGNYILSIYTISDGECVMNVGLTGSEVTHLASIVGETV